jgi:hypothetical protein
MHLEDAERPLHQGNDPPVMEVREDAPRGQPSSARAFNAARSESSRACCEDGDAPWCQESTFSINTFPE